MKQAKFIISAVNKTKQVFGAVEKSLNKLKKLGGKVTGIFASLFGVSFGAGTLALGRFVNETDRLGKSASKLGIAVDELSKLNYAAELTTGSTEGFEMALQRLERRVAEASVGMGEAQGALKSLGLDAAELVKLPLQEQFKAVADAMEGVTNSGQRLALAQKLMDSEGVKFHETMRGGRVAIEAYGDELERIGGVMSDEAVQAAEDMKRSLSQLSAQFEGIAVRYGPKVLVVVQGMADAMGLGARDLAAIDEDIAKNAAALGRTIDQLASHDGGFTLFGKSQADLVALREEFVRTLQALREEREALIDNQAQQAAQRKEREEAFVHQQQMEVLAEAETKSLKVNLKERQSAYRAHVTEVKKAREAEKAVAEEFGDILDEMRSDTQAAAEELDLIDLAGPISQAQRALGEGDYASAINFARKAGEVLRTMKEQGGESNIVLSGMAAKLKGIAEAAADARTEEEVVKLDKSKEEIEQLQAKIEQIKADPLTIAAKVDKSELDAVDKEIERVREIPVRFKVVGGVPSYGDGVLGELSTETAKRGEV
ncbi:MAG: hypothetical protein ABW066_06800 [Sedimenticola sp.]